MGAGGRASRDRTSRRAPEVDRSVVRIELRVDHRGDDPGEFGGHGLRSRRARVGTDRPVEPCRQLAGLRVPVTYGGWVRRTPIERAGRAASTSEASRWSRWTRGTVAETLDAGHRVAGLARGEPLEPAIVSASRRGRNHQRRLVGRIAVEVGVLGEPVERRYRLTPARGR